MLRIYQRAFRVVIWLGQGSTNTQLAIDQLLELSRVTNWKMEASVYIRSLWSFLNLLIWALQLPGSEGLGRTHSFSVNLLRWAFCGMYFGHLLRPSLTYLTALVFLTTPRVRQAFSVALDSILAFMPTSRVSWPAFMAASMSKFMVPRLVRTNYVPDDKSIEALQEFFSHAWFRRIWVIQEVVAAQDAVVLCGQESILWQNLYCAYDGVEYLLSRSLRGVAMSIPTTIS